MSEAYTRGSIRSPTGSRRDNVVAGAANFLSLAAAPTFAAMSLLTGSLAGSPVDVLCSASRGASPLSGMALMYALMSAFHLAPWLKLIYSRPAGP